MKKNRILSPISVAIIILSLIICTITVPMQKVSADVNSLTTRVNEENSMADVIAEKVSTASSVVSVADTNLLTGDNSTFENSVGDWEIFAGGNMEIVANPDGEGNVLKFSEPVHTWDSPSIDIRNLIQENATNAPNIRIVMDVYSPSEMTAAVRIRTAKAEDMSLTAAAGYAYILIGKATVPSNEWTEIISEFDLTEEDLSIDCSYWKLCLDGISKYTDTLYIDNIRIYVDDEEIIMLLQDPTTQKLVQSDGMLLQKVQQRGVMLHPRWRESYLQVSIIGRYLFLQIYQKREMFLFLNIPLRHGRKRQHML